MAEIPWRATCMMRICSSGQDLADDLLARKATASGGESDEVHSPEGLSPCIEQIDLIQKSFDALWPVRRRVADSFYSRFFELAPDARAPR